MYLLIAKTQDRLARFIRRIVAFNALKIPVSLLVLNLFLIAQSYAQPAIGTIWHYNKRDDTGLTTFATMVAEKDTIIASKSCLKLNYSCTATCVLISSNFIYSEGGKVFYWDQVDSVFRILYDYALNAGESYELYTNQGFLSSTITVDSTGVIMFENRQLKVQYLSSSNPTIDLRSATIEDLGNFTFFFPLHGACDPYNVSDLRCYSKGDSLVNFNSFDCEAIIAGISATGENDKELEVYPNPFTEELNIDFGGVPIDSYVIYSIEAKKLVEENPRTSLFTKLEVQTLNPGDYILKVFSSGNVFTQRIIKQ